MQGTEREINMWAQGWLCVGEGCCPTRTSYYITLSLFFFVLEFNGPVNTIKVMSCRYYSKGTG